MALIEKGTLGTRGHGQDVSPIANALGMQVVHDFFSYMALAGYAYQIRAGTITTPLVGDVVITDAAAEMAVDALSGSTVIPAYMNIGLRLLTGTLHEYAVKSVSGVSSVGAAFVPLPLKSNGAAAVSTARVAAAGGVTVPAETALTTRRHWSFANPAAGATGALPTAGYGLEWEPRMPPIWVGPWVGYVQIAATGTGPSYFASLDFLEVNNSVLF